jgi:hypothetical protein
MIFYRFKFFIVVFKKKEKRNRKIEKNKDHSEENNDYIQAARLASNFGMDAISVDLDKWAN